MKPPVRWLERPEDLPEDLLVGMRAYQEMGPSEAERARLLLALRSKGASASRMRFKSLAILSVLGGIAAIVWLARDPVATPAAQSNERQLDEVRIHVEAPLLEPQVVEPAPLPRPEPAATRKAKRVSARRETNDPAAELELLRRARRALAVAPATSMALVDEHQRSYPHGVFAQERELIAIEALVHTDRAAAKARARTFMARYPQSVHEARIRVLLDVR